jgi:hypothetical protein
LEAEFTRICGVNLKSIDGVDVMTIATLLSELGTDMARWTPQAHIQRFGIRVSLGRRTVRHDAG